ncbi:MAG: hypothetical protein M3O22_07435 [Pseudomonadota bacterium]|nr:hypothetical protein [Pseudomonadota bacterium]
MASLLYEMIHAARNRERPESLPEGLSVGEFMMESPYSLPPKTVTRGARGLFIQGRFDVLVDIYQRVRKESATASVTALDGHPVLEDRRTPVLLSALAQGVSEGVNLLVKSAPDIHVLSGLRTIDCQDTPFAGDVAKALYPVSLNLALKEGFDFLRLLYLSVLDARHNEWAEAVLRGMEAAARTRFDGIRGIGTPVPPGSDEEKELVALGHLGAEIRSLREEPATPVRPVHTSPRQDIGFAMERACLSTLDLDDGFREFVRLYERAGHMPVTGDRIRASFAQYLADMQPEKEGSITRFGALALAVHPVLPLKNLAWPHLPRFADAACRDEEEHADALAAMVTAGSGDGSWMQVLQEVAGVHDAPAQTAEDPFASPGESAGEGSGGADVIRLEERRQPRP